MCPPTHSVVPGTSWCVIKIEWMNDFPKGVSSASWPTAESWPVEKDPIPCLQRAGERGHSGERRNAAPPGALDLSDRSELCFHSQFCLASAHLFQGLQSCASHGILTLTFLCPGLRPSQVHQWSYFRCPSPGCRLLGPQRHHAWEPKGSFHHLPVFLGHSAVALEAH